jgi:hypothetical protein
VAARETVFERNRKACSERWDGKDHKAWRRHCYLPHRLILGRLRCTGLRPVPSLQVGKGLEQEGEPPMKSRPETMGSDGSTLTELASSAVGGVRCG